MVILIGICGRTARTGPTGCTAGVYATGLPWPSCVLDLALFTIYDLVILPVLLGWGRVGGHFGMKPCRSGLCLAASEYLFDSL